MFVEFKSRVCDIFAFSSQRWRTEIPCTELLRFLANFFEKSSAGCYLSLRYISFLLTHDFTKVPPGPVRIYVWIRDNFQTFNRTIWNKIPQSNSIFKRSLAFKQYYFWTKHEPYIARWYKDQFHFFL